VTEARRVTSSIPSERSDTPPSSLVLPTGQGGMPAVDLGRDPAPSPSLSPWAAVPWRTIVGTIGVVLGTGLLIIVVYLASRVIVWTLIASFFAVVLSPPVAWMQRHFGWRRGLSVAMVVLIAVLALTGLIALFIMPVRHQLVTVASDLPGTVQRTANGEGQFGRLAAKLGLQKVVQSNQTALVDAANSVEKGLPGYVGSALQYLLALVTIAVTTTLMLGQSELLGRAAMRIVPIRHRTVVSQVGKDAASAISGYMTGNLAISVCAGLFALLVLTILGVPSPLVLALWVAFADLIPLVGATMGAIVAVVAALFVSPTAGVIALVLFVLYQQFENSVLQTVIMSRTVRVSPLMVLLSVLIGVELFGFVGALLAVPVAGASSVVGKELWQHRRAAPDQLLIVSNRSSAHPDEALPKTRLADRVRSLFHRQPKGDVSGK
jgi:predicted PurR-regulated permease PerM